MKLHFGKNIRKMKGLIAVVLLASIVAIQAHPQIDGLAREPRTSKDLEGRRFKILSFFYY